MSDNLYIPSQINVGFQNRSDTYTGKLAYVTYNKDDGSIFKDKSWNPWRDNKIPAVIFDNSPTQYIINKGVSRFGHFNAGRSVVRIYDTRDFEFEISLDNLIGILMNSDVSKRDITEPCVFAWDRQTLILLPVNSEEYAKAVEYTGKKLAKFDVSTLTPGYTYVQRNDSKLLTYVGYLPWFDWVSNRDYYAGRSNETYKNKGKKHVFYDGTEFLNLNVSHICAVHSEEVVSYYASLLETFCNTRNGLRISSYAFLDKPLVHSTCMFKKGPYSDYIGVRVPPVSCNVSSLANTIFNCNFKNDLNTIVYSAHSSYAWSKPTAYIESFTKCAETLGFDAQNLSNAEAYQVLELDGFKYAVVETTTGEKFDHLDY